MSQSPQGRASVKQETAKRKAYLKPELKEYGSVSRLTRGSSSPLGDGAGGHKKSL
jgi:hypothetical protein